MRDNNDNGTSSLGHTILASGKLFQSSVRTHSGRTGEPFAPSERPYVSRDGKIMINVRSLFLILSCLVRQTSLPFCPRSLLFSPTCLFVIVFFFFSPPLVPQASELGMTSPFYKYILTTMVREQTLLFFFLCIRLFSIALVLLRFTTW